MTATAKKTTAKKAVAKKTAVSKQSSDASKASATNSVEPKAAAAAASNQQVEPRKDLSEQVPPVNTHEALNAVNYEGHEDKPKTKTVDVEYIYPTHTDPNRRIPGPNPYLDDVERARAEIVRAAVEDREPDLENPPAYQGSPLVAKDAFLAANAPYTNAEGVKTVDLPVTVLKD